MRHEDEPDKDGKAKHNGRDALWALFWVAVAGALSAIAWMAAR